MSTFSPVRWTHEATEKGNLQALDQSVRNLADHIGAQKPERPKSHKWAWTLGVAAGMLLFIALIAFLTSLGDSEKRELPPLPVRIAIFSSIILIPSGIAYAIASSVGKKRIGRFEGLESLVGSGVDLVPLYGQDLEDFETGLFPWLPCEFRDPTFKAWASGTYKGHDLHWIEGEHVVDPLVEKESGIEKSIGGLVKSKDDRCLSRKADIIVFRKPLTKMPDLILTPRKDPVKGYAKLKFGKGVTEVELPDLNPKTFLEQPGVSVLVSDASVADKIVSEELKPRLGKEGLFIQILGGYVAMHGTTCMPGFYNCAADETQITEFLDQMTQLYDILSRVNDSLG